MNEAQTIELLRRYADKYNDMRYFEEDPIIFPKHFAALLAEGKASLQDVETAAAIAAHLAWGRRSMIVRDCTRAMDEMGWQPYEYVRTGQYRDEDKSLHRTVKWSEFAAICRRIKEFYDSDESMEVLSPGQMRTRIYDRCGQGYTGRRTTRLRPTRRYTCCAGGWSATTGKWTWDCGSTPTNGT